MTTQALMQPDSRIAVTGGSGMVGTALVRALRDAGFRNVLSMGSADCNLLDWNATHAFFQQHRPEFVFHIAARVFGLMGHMKNKGVAYLDNILINTHTIEASRSAGWTGPPRLGAGDRRGGQDRHCHRYYRSRAAPLGTGWHGTV